MLLCLLKFIIEAWLDEPSNGEFRDGDEHPELEDGVDGWWCCCWYGDIDCWFGFGSIMSGGGRFDLEAHFEAIGLFSRWEELFLPALTLLFCFNGLLF